MLDKFKEEEQTFLSTSPDSSDFEELPPDVPHLVEFLPPSPQEEQLLIADSVLPASKEEQPGITSHDFKSMERTENGATGVLVQEEPWAPTCAPNDNSNIGNYNDNYHCSIVPDMNSGAAVASVKETWTAIHLRGASTTRWTRVRPPQLRRSSPERL